MVIKYLQNSILYGNTNRDANTSHVGQYSKETVVSGELRRSPGSSIPDQKSFWYPPAWSTASIFHRFSRLSCRFRSFPVFGVIVLGCSLCSDFQRFMKGFSVDGTSLPSLPSVLWWITIDCNRIINQCQEFITNLTPEPHKLLHICFSSEVHTDTR